jgi:hypothetical protein
MEHYIKQYKPRECEENAIITKAYNEMKSKDTSVVINGGKENEYIFVEEKYTDGFHITSVSREDFNGVGYDASKLTDSEMENLADLLGDYFCECGGFWDYLTEYALGHNLPKVAE